MNVMRSAHRNGVDDGADDWGPSLCSQPFCSQTRMVATDSFPSARPAAMEAEGADAHVDAFPVPVPRTASFLSLRDDATREGSGRVCQRYESWTPLNNEGWPHVCRTGVGRF